MYFQILNLPPEIRSKYEYLEVYGILNGTHPADTTLLYNKLVDELVELWETGCGVWDSFSEEYVRVRCMLLGVIMDYKGLVDAAKRMDVNAYKCCMKCPTKGCYSEGLSRIFYAFNKQNPPGMFSSLCRTQLESFCNMPSTYINMYSTYHIYVELLVWCTCHSGPPDDYTHAFVKRMGEIHEILSKSGWSKAEMMERFTAIGIKLPSAMARLVYFDLVLDWLFDPMHEIMNLGNRLAKTLLGLDFNEGVRNFAKEQGVHPEWLQTEWVQNTKGEFQHQCNIPAIAFNMS